jgi:pimeloyl-ACP methyl ester carboxylesterase
MSSQSFSHKDLSIHFTKFGSGSTPLFAFHGFGRTGQDFELFEPYLSEKYTVFAFDLFLHGNSPFSADRIESNPIKETELQLFFQAFTAHFDISTFSLMGYSLGGKVALSLLQLFPDSIKEIYLLAPDGIVLNRWYNFTSKSAIGRALYRVITNKPAPYFALLKILKKSGIIREKMHTFLLENMKTKEKRQLVYDIWLTFSSIKPNIKKIQNSIIKNNISCHLFFGKHDNIIKPKIGKNFASKLPNNATFHLINCGHVLIREQTGQLIQQYITKNK